jgi:acyl carrier protein
MNFEKVAKILAEYKDIDVADITLDTTFEELGLDSLDIVELVMNIEEEFGVSLEVNEQMKKVSDLVDLL